MVKLWLCSDSSLSGKNGHEADRVQNRVVSASEILSDYAVMELTHLKEGASFTESPLRVGQVKEIYEMKGASHSIKGIRGRPGLAYRQQHGSPMPKIPRALAAETAVSTGFQVVSLHGIGEPWPRQVAKESRSTAPGLQALSYYGRYSTVKSYISPSQPCGEHDAPETGWTSIVAIRATLTERVWRGITALPPRGLEMTLPLKH